MCVYECIYACMYVCVNVIYIYIYVYTGCTMRTGLSRGQSAAVACC